MKTTMFATVRLRVPGFHCWPDAQGERGYLQFTHRHLFHVEASLEVFHEEREIEYHDHLDFCRATFGCCFRTSAAPILPKE